MKKQTKMKLHLIYNRTVYAIIFVYCIIIFTLIFYQYSIQKTHKLKTIENDFNKKLFNIDSTISPSNRYINRLKALAINTLNLSKNSKFHSHLFKKFRFKHNFFHLHIENKTNIYHGNIHGLKRLDFNNQNYYNELNMALKLFEFQKITHDTIPFFLWSYYISKNGFSSIFPYLQLENIYKKKNYIDIQKITKKLYSMEHWKLGLPKNNPKKKNYWTDAYIDIPKNILIATHAGPIYHKKKFIGIVAVDIKLNFLKKLIGKKIYKNDKFMIINKNKQILTHTDYDLKKEKKVLSVDKFIPKKITYQDLKISKNIKIKNGYIIISKKLKSAPWKFIHIIPESDIRRVLLPEVKIYLSLFISLILFIIISHYRIKHLFIRPAIALVNYIETEAKTGHSAIPKLPNIWKLWFNRVSDMLKLKSLAGNLPGGMLQIERTASGNYSLPFISIGSIKLISQSIYKKFNLEQINETLKKYFPGLIEELNISAKKFSQINFELQLTKSKNQKNEKWIQIICHPRKNNQSIVWDGLILDISKRKKFENSLHQTEETYKAIFDNAIEGIFQINPKNNILKLNYALAKMFGYSENPELLKTKNFFSEDFFINIKDANKFINTLKNNNFINNYEVEMKRKNGEKFWTSISAKTIRDYKKRLLHYDGLIRDITKFKLKQMALHEKATLDDLTKIPNRYSFKKSFSKMLEQAKRTNIKLAVFYMDLDDFKIVNDKHGHKIGDLLLKKVASRLKDSLRRSDIIARLGGDEFTAILWNIADIDTVKKIAEEFIKTINKPYIINKIKCHIGLSIGISIYPYNKGNIEELLTKADKALYKSKEKGKNKFIISGE